MLLNNSVTCTPVSRYNSHHIAKITWELRVQRYEFRQAPHLIEIVEIAIQLSQSVLGNAYLKPWSPPKVLACPLSTPWNHNIQKQWGTSSILTTNLDVREAVTIDNCKKERKFNEPVAAATFVEECLRCVRVQVGSYEKLK